MMDTRTILIPKKFESLDIGDFRPITVLGCLIRIHSKFAAFFTMSAWASKIPASVCGGVPGRDIKVFTWLQQFDVELSLIEGTDMGGFSLDLARAFNTIPRAPLAALMKKMGISARDVDFWIDSLGGMRRSLAFKGTLKPYIFGDRHPRCDECRCNDLPELLVRQVHGGGTCCCLRLCG